MFNNSKIERLPLLVFIETTNFVYNFRVKTKFINETLKYKPKNSVIRLYHSNELYNVPYFYLGTTSHFIKHEKFPTNLQTLYFVTKNDTYGITYNEFMDCTYNNKLKFIPQSYYKNFPESIRCMELNYSDKITYQPLFYKDGKVLNRSISFRTHNDIVSEVEELIFPEKTLCCFVPHFYILDFMKKYKKHIHLCKKYMFSPHFISYLVVLKH